MNLATKLATSSIVAGVMIGGALILKKLVRSRRAGHVTPTNETEFAAGTVAIAQLEEDLAVIATQSGIADVDPEPISHVAGEGIDLDRDIAAHEEIAEQRDRLAGLAELQDAVGELRSLDQK